MRGHTQTIYPSLTYVDLKASLEWLERALGFERVLVVPGAGGTIVHAEVRADGDLFLLDPVGESESGADCGLFLHPSKHLGAKRSSPRLLGRATLALYDCIADPDARYAKAKAAGAAIVREIADADYGSRGFTVRDLEGYQWSFGTYSAMEAGHLNPSLRYADATSAVAWLERALGFERKLVVAADDGEIMHAEMSFGTGVVMFGSLRDDDSSIDSPQRLGANTGGIYSYVADPDALFQRALSADARVVRRPENIEYDSSSSREFTIEDPEGNAWTFGTCRP